MKCLTLRVKKVDRKINDLENWVKGVFQKRKVNKKVEANFGN